MNLLRRSLVFTVAAAAFFAVGALSLSAEERTLLAPDGTLYTLRSGLAIDLGVTGSNIRPTDSLIEWTSLGADGKKGLGVVPNTVGSSQKTNLDLAFDDSTGTLVALWKGIAKPLALAAMIGTAFAGFFHYMKVGPNESEEDET